MLIDSPPEMRDKEVSGGSFGDGEEVSGEVSGTEVFGDEVFGEVFGKFSGTGGSFREVFGDRRSNHRSFD
jgi:hypothetical protein